MKYLVLCFVIIIASSCIKDYASVSSSILVNSTSHTIKILPYMFGDPLFSQSITLQPNSKDSIFRTKPVKGKSLGDPYGVFLRPYDSVIVLFNNVKSSKHQRFGDSTTCDRCISITNHRAISNPDNWTKEIQKEFKHYLHGSFTYTFTEQDFLNAK
jgi:hypothetical protein